MFIKHLVYCLAIVYATYMLEIGGRCDVIYIRKSASRGMCKIVGIWITPPPGQGAPMPQFLTHPPFALVG